jgi:hypothetical protein
MIMRTLILLLAVLICASTNTSQALDGKAAEALAAAQSSCQPAYRRCFDQCGSRFVVCYRACGGNTKCINTCRTRNSACEKQCDTTHCKR